MSTTKLDISKFVSSEFSSNNILDRLQLGTCTWDKSQKEGRIAYGQAAERVALEMLWRSEITARLSFSVGYGVDAYFNKINGDIDFANNISKRHEFIDAKAGTWVSMTSIHSFRQDGWYMLNCLSRSKRKFYFLVRNNQALLDLIAAGGLEKGDMDRFREEGYHFDFRRLQGPGIEIFNGFNPNAGAEIINEIALALDERFGSGTAFNRLQQND